MSPLLPPETGLEGGSEGGGCGDVGGWDSGIRGRGGVGTLGFGDRGTSGTYRHGNVGMEIRRGPG